MQKDPEQALDQLRNRYAVPDRIREYHFELRNRNFNSETDDALANSIEHSSKVDYFR